MFGHAADLHVEMEIDLGKAGGAADGGATAVMRRGGQRDVAFAGEQAAGRVQADPPRARHEHLRPRVEVGEVGGRPARSVEAGYVRGELDEVAAARIGALLGEPAGRGLGVCLTTHDAAFAARHADRESRL